MLRIDWFSSLGWIAASMACMLLRHWFLGLLAALVGALLLVGAFIKDLTDER